MHHTDEIKETMTRGEVMEGTSSKGKELESAEQVEITTVTLASSGGENGKREHA